MPFSSMFKSSRLSQQFERKDAPSANGTMEKDRPKRGFLRRLLKGSSNSNSNGVDGRQSPTQKAAKSVHSSIPDRALLSPTPTPRSEPPSSPMADPNKPLPPPPLQEAVTEEPPPKPILKLDRIIAPIGIEDLQKLFSGAPQFLARSEGHGLPAPCVAYPYDSGLSTEELSDHVPLEDPWQCATAWPEKNSQGGSKFDVIESTTFVPRCWERPSILSMQGLEKGTMGFQAALEIGIADALQDPDDIYNAKNVSERRWKALEGKEGVRPLTDSALIERLLSVMETYHEDEDKNQRPSIQLYTELFTHTLHPPARLIDVDDPYSLLVQINALVQVLTAEHLWFDFSKVEWRIRLGQLLWNTSYDFDEGVDINDETVHESTTQRYWLLLQILLACELLTRLDMIVANVEDGKHAVDAEEIRLFEKSANPSVRWSILLARTWLENIRIQGSTSAAITEEKQATGWLSTLTGGGASQPEHVSKDSINDLKFEGRHQARQVRGLVNFARKIKWPNTDAIIAKVSANGIVISESVGNTPLSTPRSVSTQRSSSYFSKRPGLRRGLSSMNRSSAIIHPSGWLSNSYVSGLILPGESLSHFLISTLLENDSDAVAKLGEDANLYGGFVYQSKSFWSVSCIVGRVLAAGKGSSESMGWISSDVVPKGVKEQWVDIDVEPTDEVYFDRKEKRPRILRKTTIEQRGHIIAGADEFSVLPGDFITPADKPLDDSVSVTLQALDLFAIDDTTPPTPVDKNDTPLTDPSEVPYIKVYTAMMRFTLGSKSGDEPLKEVNVSLSNDIFFLTAHPCAPSAHATTRYKSDTSKYTSRTPKTSLSTAHPLHEAFTYTQISLAHLLSTPISATFSSLLSPTSSPTAAHFSSQHTTSSGIPKVLVIDCTDSASEPNLLKSMSTNAAVGSDMEILGRAVCSERGWNALVSRRGRGCLSCAIREAGAIGWRVILRVA